MRTILISLLLTFGHSTYGQNDCFGEGSPREPLSSSVRKGLDNFSLKLFRDIAVSNPEGNMVLSPYSVWSVLSLAYFGAKGNTELQLQNVLGIPSKAAAFYGRKDIEATLSSYNGTTFSKADKFYFDETIGLTNCAINKLAELEKIRFRDATAAVNKINNYISAATKGEIPNFLTAQDVSRTLFLLLNAVYFKGFWKHNFDKADTVDREFYDETGKIPVSKTSMMNTEALLPYGHSALLKASVLELPYEGSNISMLLILPDAEVATVKSVLGQLTSSLLDDFKKEQISNVSVTLPRFKMNTKIEEELKTALKKMGVVDLFDAFKSNLLNFFTDNAYVEKSIHESTIEVTEEGTVATAVTALTGTKSGFLLKRFNANRPFIFIIRDMSQGISLFTGVLRDPSQTNSF